MAEYAIGNKPRFTVTFTDVFGGLANPTTVVCKVRDPAGVITTPVITNDSTGIYHADYATSLALQGTWYVRFEGTGAVVAADERSFVVDVSAFS